MPGQAPFIPGPDPLVVGSVPFNSQECPNSLPIGHAEQMIAVSELIGGGRVVQTFGAQMQPITFSGTFWNVNIQPRVELLRSYCRAGTEQQVTWRNETYYGKIRSFKPTYRNANKCDYEITIEVTRDSNGSFSNAQPTSVDTQVTTLSANATSTYGKLLAADPKASSWQQGWSTTQLSIQQGAPLSQATPTQATAIGNNITAVNAQVDTYIASLPAVDSRVVLATQFKNSLSLISKNVQAGQAPQTLIVQGGSLSAIAAKYYGDPSLGSAIAAANGLSSTRLSDGVETNLVLPPFTSVI